MSVSCYYWGSEDYRHEVTDELLNHAERVYCKNSSFCSSTFECYANHLREDFSITAPSSLADALKFYFLIIEDINSMIWYHLQIATVWLLWKSVFDKIYICMISQTCCCHKLDTLILVHCMRQFLHLVTRNRCLQLVLKKAGGK